MNCAGDVLNAGALKDVPSIARAMFVADTLAETGIPFKDVYVRCVVREVGARPDVGAFLAHVTKWGVVSTGTKLRGAANFGKVDRLAIEGGYELEFLTNGPLVTVDVTEQYTPEFHMAQKTDKSHAERVILSCTSKWHDVPKYLGAVPSIHIDLEPYGYNRAIWAWVL
jgi:hypothetical protein